MSLDAEFAKVLPALNSYFPRVEAMTGQQLRTVIRERAVPPPHPAPVRAVADRTVPSSAGDIAVRIYWPEQIYPVPCPSSSSRMAAGSCFAIWIPTTNYAAR